MVSSRTFAGLGPKMLKASRDYYTDPSSYDLRCSQDLKLKQTSLVNFRGLMQMFSHRLITVRESQEIPESQVSYILGYADSAAAFQPHISIR